MKVCFVVSIVILSMVAALSIAAPGRDFFPGQESNAWHYDFVKSFYGPWKVLRKANGEYADYTDYGTYVQDYQPSPEAVAVQQPVIAEGPAADFQSNYDVGSSGFAQEEGYGEDQADPAIFDAGIQSAASYQSSGEDDHPVYGSEDPHSSGSVDGQSYSDVGQVETYGIDDTEGRRGNSDDVTTTDCEGQTGAPPEEHR